MVFKVGQAVLVQTNISTPGYVDGTIAQVVTGTASNGMTVNMYSVGGTPQWYGPMEFIWVGDDKIIAKGEVLA